MNRKILRLKRVALAAMMFLLIGAAGMTKANAQSTVGNDFWVTFLSNYDGSVNLSLIAAGSSPCTGTVTNPYTNWSTEFEVSVGATTIIDIPWSEAYAHYESDCIVNTGLHVVTTDTISLYASNFQSYTFDVTDVLPTYSLGSNYIIQTYPGVEANGRGGMVSPSSDSRNLATSSSEFSVVAVEDNTTVYITLTDNSMNGHYANQPFSVTLNAGQCYQVMSVVDGNLTGSQVSVSGNKRVAVFAGNSCANVPTNCPYCDHIVEQMMPVSCWGNHFVVTNSSMRSYDEVRVTAANNNCQIFINGSYITTINQKQTYQFEIYSDDPSMYLETSEPAMVYLYYVGSECAGQMGDPSMVMISPIEQRMDYVTFSTFNSGASQYHFVNVVTNTDDVAFMQLDGNSIASEFQTVSGNSGYAFARIAIEHGSHTLFTTGNGFVAHVYGLGDDESYAYAVGSNAVQELYTNMLVNGQTASDDTDVCDETVNFDLNYNYNVSQVNWTYGDGQTGSGIPVTHQYAGLGDYTVSCDVYKLDVNGQDSLVATLTTELHIYESYETEFSVTSHNSYYWAEEEYMFSGDYEYNFHTIHGCDSIVTLHLTITHEITAMANPTEGGTVTGGGSYNQEATCTLTATANTGYDFMCWMDETGTVVSLEPQYSFVVTQDNTLTANFVEEGYCGVKFDLYDSYGDGWTGNYLVVSYGEGSYQELTLSNGTYATYILPIADGSHVVLSWISGSYIGECSFRVSYLNDNEIYYGYGNNMNNNSFGFDMDCVGMPVTPYYDIAVTVNPYEGGTVNGAGTYRQGETCTLVASSSNGYTFVNWTLEGTVVSTEQTYSFTVTGSENYTANFEPVSYTITATADPTEGGTVTGGGTYNYNETCTLTATPNEGYMFLNWTNEYGEVVSYYSEYTFTVIGDDVLTASFAEEGSVCQIVFDLYDSYGDGWNGNCLVVNFEDGTSQNITFSSGSYSTQTLLIENGSHITLGWIAGSYISECSFMVCYADETVIYQGTNLSGTTFEFDVNCGGTPTTYTINVEANPEDGGTVSGGGIFTQDQTCMLTATANEGYIFMNWTKDDQEVSTEATYSFVVTESATYVANFLEDEEFHWTFDPYLYPDNITITGIIQIDGVEQYNPALEVGAFCNDTCRGTVRPTFNADFDRYFLFFTVYGNDGDVINFRLYDHSTGMVSNKVCEPMVFEPNATLGNITNPYVFNFVSGNGQIVDFAQGWNWWSSYIELDGINGLQMLEDGLSSNGMTIKSQNDGFNSYMDGFGWYGSLTSINNESSYQIKVTQYSEVEMQGGMANPANHPITLHNGWTWIGYPVPTSMNLEEALSGFNPETGDMLKSQNEGFASYMEGLGWYGSLGTLNPGMGLMYKSNNGSEVTFTYPNGSSKGELKPNQTAEHNHWVPDLTAYPNNMSVMVVVELDGEELRSENYELAAFANGECRGSARLMYVEPLNRYMAFLTVAGDEAAELHFGLYNTETGAVETVSTSSLQYETNAVVGNFETPYVVRFRSIAGVDEWASSLQVYPNPVGCGQMISLGTIDAEIGTLQVEIINALGVVETRRATSLQMITAPNIPGVYTLRITVEGEGMCYRRLIVR